MKIGIGITTTPNRKALFDECLHSMQQHTSFANLYIHNDTEKKGVAYSKNMCLHNLKDNDFIFLFDDDCRPKSSEWLPYIIQAFEITYENHFLLLDDKLHTQLQPQHININRYKDCGGVFMALTGKALNEVGYMDSRYKLWGFEHAGWSNRVFNIGLNSSPYLMPRDLRELIYSCDYEGEQIESSVTEAEKKSNYEHNSSIFLEEHKHIGFKPFKP